MDHRPLNKKEGTRDKAQGTKDRFSFLVSRASDRGFTFVETLVAISILLMAIAAPLTLASQSLTASRIARDQIIATYLAQEVIEYARNMRDTNTLAGHGWLEGLEECIGTTCMIDVPAASIESCGEKGDCSPLRFDQETGFYGLSTDKSATVVTTKYTRSLLIEISEKNASEARLAALVTWKEGMKDRSVLVEESIFDWQ